MRIAWILTALIVCGALISDAFAAANTRQMAVYADGRVQAVSGLGLESFSCEDEGLAFVFSETVNGEPPPQQLALGDSAQATAERTVRVEITQTCGEGEAAFQYAHEAAGAGSIPKDLDISPEQFSISVATSQGASATRKVMYQLTNGDEPRDEETVTLFGDRIVFFVEDTAGQATDRRDLLDIRIPANNPDTVDPADLPENTPEEERDVVDSLNEACRRAEPGSELDETCNEIRNSQNEQPDQDQRQQQARRIARQLDPSAVTEAAVASLETIGRVQHENILNRLISLREGSRGADVSDLRLAVNGQSFDSSWIQNYLVAEEEAGGGSRLLSEEWGVFFNGLVSLGDQDFQRGTGYEFDVYGLTGGVDYRFRNGLILGGSIGLSHFDSSIDNSGGALDSDSISVQGFGTYNLGENFYVDTTVAYMRSDIEQARKIDLSGVGSESEQTVRGSADASQFAASLALNYQTTLGNGWSMTNYGSFYFADTHVDQLTEKGSSLALVYDEREFDSLLSSLGLRVSKVFNLQRGVMTGFADVAFKYESKDRLNVNTAFAAVDAPGPTVVIEDADKDFGTLGIGATWIFLNGNQVFVKFDTLFDDSARTRTSFYIGGRIEF